jgi:hypothetical protein
MKFKLWPPAIAKLLVLLTAFYVFMPQLALAGTYGAGAYGSCRYSTGCAQPHRGFFDRYGWLIFFATLILISLLWLILLLARRRRKSTDEDQLLPPPPQMIQP